MTELEPVARIDPEVLKELEKWPTASATVWSGKASHRFAEAAEPLVTLSSAQSAIAVRDVRIAELEAAIDIVLNNAKRVDMHGNGALNDIVGPWYMDQLRVARSLASKIGVGNE